MKPLSLFLGKDRPFKLDTVHIVELETLCGAGIGTIAKRLLSDEFHIADLTEVIRLGMIGGGSSPREAAITIDLYVKDRPLTEVLPIARAILSALYFGTVFDAPSNENAEGQSDAA